MVILVVLEAAVLVQAATAEVPSTTQATAIKNR
jgi:hypothetical protein